MPIPFSTTFGTLPTQLAETNVATSKRIQNILFILNKFNIEIYSHLPSTMSNKYTIYCTAHGTFGEVFSHKIHLMSRMNIIGDRVRLARKKANPPITQTDLAARLQTHGMHMERITITKIETGYREVSDIEAKAIAEALGVSISWLYGEE